MLKAFYKNKDPVSIIVQLYRNPFNHINYLVIMKFNMKIYKDTNVQYLYFNRRGLTPYAINPFANVIEKSNVFSQKIFDCHE